MQFENMNDAFNAAMNAESKGDYDTALAMFREIVEFRPTDTQTLEPLARVMFRLGLYDEVLSTIELALAIDPMSAALWYIKANAEYKLSGALTAEKSLRRCLDIAPFFPSARWTISHIDLMLGRYKEGFEGYEWGRANDMRPNRCPGAYWDGGPVPKGSKLYLYAEQGLGDTIMFARWLGFIVERFGGEVVFECQEEVANLFIGIPGLTVICRKLDMSVAISGVTHFLSLMSIPFTFGLGADDFWYGEYVKSKSPLTLEGKPFKVGLCWKGGAGHRNDKERSCTLNDMVPILKQDATFYSLVKDAGGVTVQGDFETPPDMRGGDLSTFDKTANLIAGLDLVITVDTAVAHLAGAMGVPCWIVTPQCHDWRWLAGCDETPWYPSAKLFRQASPSDWEVVMNKVAETLALRINKPAEATV